MVVVLFIAIPSALWLQLPFASSEYPSRQYWQLCSGVATAQPGMDGLPLSTQTKPLST